MKKLRFGYLGVGPRGQNAMETYSHHPQVEFVAFCDIEEGTAEAVAAHYNKTKGGSAKAFTRYEDMVRDVPMDAMLIACDPDVQVDYAVDAMNRGIHVMTEVPAAYSIKQCWDLVNTVKKTGAKYQLAEQTRYWHFFSEWRRMAREGEFGKIIYAEGQYLHYEPVWDSFVERKTYHRIRSKDPCLYNDPELLPSWRGRLMRSPILYLPHTLSPLLSVTGGRISKVACFGTRPMSYSMEGMYARDLQHAIMYNTEDILFSVRTGFTSPHSQNNICGAHWYQVKGTKASVEIARSDIDTSKKWTVDGGWTETSWGTADPEAEEYIKNSGHGGADWYPINAFVDAILNDKTPPMDVYKAVETAAPAILAAESCEKGGVMLEVPDFRA